MDSNQIPPSHSCLLVFIRGSKFRPPTLTHRKSEWSGAVDNPAEPLTIFCYPRSTTQYIFQNQ